MNRAWVRSPSRPVWPCSHHLDLAPPRGGGEPLVHGPRLHRGKGGESSTCCGRSRGSAPSTAPIRIAPHLVERRRRPPEPDVPGPPGFPSQGMHVAPGVTVAPASAGDRYGDVLWILGGRWRCTGMAGGARPGPGPGGLRRPLWLDRPCGPPRRCQDLTRPAGLSPPRSASRFPGPRAWSLGQVRHRAAMHPHDQGLHDIASATNRPSFV